MHPKRFARRWVAMCLLVGAVMLVAALVVLRAALRDTEAEAAVPLLALVSAGIQLMTLGALIYLAGQLGLLFAQPQTARSPAQRNPKTTRALSLLARFIGIFVAVMGMFVVGLAGYVLLKWKFRVPVPLISIAYGSLDEALWSGAEVIFMVSLVNLAVALVLVLTARMLSRARSGSARRDEGGSVEVTPQ